MTFPSPSQIRIKSIDDRLARLRAERTRLAERASSAERKRDTRRKILIGGAVLAAVEHEGVPRLESSQALTRWMDTRLTRTHDREVFDLAAVKSANKHSDVPHASERDSAPQVPPTARAEQA